MGGRRISGAHGCRWRPRPCPWCGRRASARWPSPTVAEELLQHEGDVAHQVDRVVPRSIHGRSDPVVVSVVVSSAGDSITAAPGASDITTTGPGYCCLRCALWAPAPAVRWARHGCPQSPARAVVPPPRDRSAPRRALKGMGRARARQRRRSGCAPDGGTVAAYVALTAAHQLLLITTIPTMVLAERGAAALMAISCSAARSPPAAPTLFNDDVDRDIDAGAAHAGPPARHGGAAARPDLRVILETPPRRCGPATCWRRCWRCRRYALRGRRTLWLKRTSRHNIVMAVPPGAVPVLVGWAVTNSLGWAPIILFIAMFLDWGAHPLATQLPTCDAAGRRPLPGRQADGRLHRHWGQHAGTAPVASSAGSTRHRSWPAALSPHGGAHPQPTPGASMRVFAYSITYVTLLFSAITVDVLVLA